MTKLLTIKSLHPEEHGTEVITKVTESINWVITLDECENDDQKHV